MSMYFMVFRQHRIPFDEDQAKKIVSDLLGLEMDQGRWTGDRTLDHRLPSGQPISFSLDVTGRDRFIDIRVGQLSPEVQAILDGLVAQGLYVFCDDGQWLPEPTYPPGKAPPTNRG